MRIEPLEEIRQIKCKLRKKREMLWKVKIFDCQYQLKKLLVLKILSESETLKETVAQVYENYNVICVN